MLFSYFYLKIWKLVKTNKCLTAEKPQKSRSKNITLNVFNG